MIVYGYMTNWNEWVVFLALLMLVGLCLMVGGYLLFTAKRVGNRPEDRVDGEIHDERRDIGIFSPSWELVAIGPGFGSQLASLAWLLAGGSSSSAPDWQSLAFFTGWVYGSQRWRSRSLSSNPDGVGKQFCFCHPVSL